MKFQEVKATKETIDMKKGGIIIYETDVTTDSPAVILTYNPTGDHTVALLSTYHPGGPVTIYMKGIGASGNKKYAVGDIIAKLLILE